MKTLKKILFAVCSVGIGAVLGWFIGMACAKSDTNFFVMLAGLFVSVYLQLIIHEGGHLVFGLLSGYQFGYFKIGNLMLLKRDGKFVLKSVKIVGMGGQCMMAPPDLVDGQMPTTLYNLGGVMANIIISALCLAVYLPAKNVPILATFLISMVLIGVFIALTNGIPMKIGMMPNDGYNLLHLGKNKAAQYALWTQLKVATCQTDGKRLQDLPDHWLFLPQEGKDNVLIAAVGVFYANRLLDMQQFEETVTTIETLLSGEYAVVELHRQLLRCDLIYCYLKLGKPIDDLLDKKLKGFMKQMGQFPSVIRTQYALALHEGNDKKAAAQQTLFEKVAKRYPFPGDIESERELMGAL